jgi:SnoaL-like domain
VGVGQSAAPIARYTSKSARLHDSLLRNGERKETWWHHSPVASNGVARLIRVGAQELTGEDEAEADAYFALDFTFHGPDGADTDHAGLKGYFASLRAAFDDLTVSRGIMAVEDDYIACQTTMAGTFVREFTHSPVGPAAPERQARHVRAHEHLQVRRSRAACGGVGANGQPEPATAAGRRRPLRGNTALERAAPARGHAPTRTRRQRPPGPTTVGSAIVTP